MKLSLSLLFIALWLLSGPIVVSAQTKLAKQTDPASKAASQNAPPNVDAEQANEKQRLAAERRAVATSLLFDLAEASREFRDLMLRARVQARAADLIWFTDPDRARVLFRRAWDAADAIDRENERKAEEQQQAALKTGGSYSFDAPPRAREEVLRLASQRDRALGEELLRKLAEAEKEEAELEKSRVDKAQNSSTNRSPFELTPAQRERMQLASALLYSGDVKRAVKFAEPLLGIACAETIHFLSVLREKDVAQADGHYVALLARVEVYPAVDANLVSLLSSYVFNDAEFDNDDLRQHFIRVAEPILLRPLPPSEQGASGEDASINGRMEKYDALNRLLPYFERYAPAETTANLRSVMSALQADVPDWAKQENTNGSPLTNLSPGEDFVERVLERAARIENVKERDQFYASGALDAANLNDPRARDLVDKIEDSVQREKIRGFVDFTLTANALAELRRQMEEKRKSQTSIKQKKASATEPQASKKKTITTEEVLRSIRNGELTHFQRVWALSEVVRILTGSDKRKTNKERSLSLLEDAATEARRISRSNPSHAQALVGIAVLFFDLDRARSWELANEVVKAANDVKNYTGTDTLLSVQLLAEHVSTNYSASLPDSDLTSLFPKLAQADLIHAIAQARSFQGETPRSTAMLAIAQSVLEQKSKPVDSRQ